MIISCICWDCAASCSINNGCIYIDHPGLWLGSGRANIRLNHFFYRLKQKKAMTYVLQEYNLIDTS